MFGWKKAATYWQKSAESWKKSADFWRDQAFAQRALTLQLLVDLRNLLPKEYEGSEKLDKLLQKLKDFTEEHESSEDSEEDH